jgi:hypothetical protein
MIAHHLRDKRPHWVKSLVFNALGAMTTFIVLIVIALTKFLLGAWMVILLIPFMVLVFKRIHNHYAEVRRELTLSTFEKLPELKPMKHTVIVPISGMHRGTIEALRYGLSISDDVRVCYVEINPEATEWMLKEWKKWAQGIPLTILKSPYRSVIWPILNYIDDMSNATKDDVITVLIPEFVTSKWWHQFLHNQTALMIRAALIFKRGKVITSVRYYLRTT